MKLSNVLAFVILLALGTVCNAQLGGILGAVANTVASVGGIASAAVGTAASVVANVGFNLGWWNAGDVVLNNLAIANAQISVQGCTTNIYNGILGVQQTAIVDGYGPVFLDNFNDIDVVGPGMYHCFHNDYGSIYAIPARQWAIANGYVFGRRRSLQST